MKHGKRMRVAGHSLAAVVNDAIAALRNGSQAAQAFFAQLTPAVALLAIDIFNTK